MKILTSGNRAVLLSMRVVLLDKPCPAPLTSALQSVHTHDPWFSNELENGVITNKFSRIPCQSETEARLIRGFAFQIGASSKDRQTDCITSTPVTFPYVALHIIPMIISYLFASFGVWGRLCSHISFRHRGWRPELVGTWGLSEHWVFLVLYLIMILQNNTTGI